MTVRLTVSLPDDIHAGLTRVASSSNVSASSVVRAILSDIVPRMTSVMDYLGSSPVVSPTQIAEADAWLKDINALLGAAPETFRDAVGEIPRLEQPRTNLDDEVEQ